MRCPKCQFDHELQTTECLKCGIVFSRYQAAMDLGAKQAAVTVPMMQAGEREIGPVGTSGRPKGRPYQTMGAPIGQAAGSTPDLAPALGPDASFTVRDDDFDASRELKYRVLALPLALLVGRWMVGTGLRLPVSMLTMVLHESGHAITAWLTGRWAVPMLWVTYHGEVRSWPFVLTLTCAICFGGFLAWRAERWGWVGIAGAVLLLQLIMLRMPNPEALIVFGGDGGALALATILVATFYAPRESALYKNWGLRWALLAIGAPVFMQVFRAWTGPIEDIPFGEIEGVNLSDPSLLTVMYGWSSTQLVDRYVRLGTVCLVVLAGLYVWGLLPAYLETRAAESRRETAEASRLPRRNALS